MPLGIWPPGLVHPSLPPRQSPAPGVGYNYGAELGNCAGGSFPRKNGQRYRLHLDLHRQETTAPFAVHRISHGSRRVVWSATWFAISRIRLYHNAHRWTGTPRGGDMSRRGLISYSGIDDDGEATVTADGLGCCGPE